MGHQDDIARLRAEADQSKELMRELAGTAFAFHSGCLEAGFDEEQALQLTQTWLVTLIQTAPLSQLSGDTAELFKKIFGEDEGL